jgi:hypothetical protein
LKLEPSQGAIRVQVGVCVVCDDAVSGNR